MAILIPKEIDFGTSNVIRDKSEYFIMIEINSPKGHDKTNVYVTDNFKIRDINSC